MNKTYKASATKMKVKMPMTKPGGMMAGNPNMTSMMKPMPGVTSPAVGTPQNVMAQRISKMRAKIK